MRLTMHSRDGLFKKNLKGYCQEKLTRPIERHRLDDEATRLDIDGQTVGEEVEIRIRLALPHRSPLTAHKIQEGEHAASHSPRGTLNTIIRINII